MDSKEPVIRLHFLSVFCITAKEYAEIWNTLQVKALLGDVGISERVLLILLSDMQYRYNEICAAAASAAAATRSLQELKKTVD